LPLLRVGRLSLGSPVFDFGPLIPGREHETAGKLRKCG
jgi:hypothetical protein